jgi:hypothetical protein
MEEKGYGIWSWRSKMGDKASIVCKLRTLKFYSQLG